MEIIYALVSITVFILFILTAVNTMSILKIVKTMNMRQTIIEAQLKEIKAKQVI